MTFLKSVHFNFNESCIFNVYEKPLVFLSTLICSFAGFSSWRTWVKDGPCGLGRGGVTASAGLGYPGAKSDFLHE